MRLKFSKSTSKKTVGRLKKKARIRNKVEGTADRPRLAVFKSLNHIYAQIVDDSSKKTIVSASSLKVDAKQSGISLAKLVGEEIAKKAKEQSINEVVFDRSGFIYHGRIKAVADAAREAGLKF